MKETYPKYYLYRRVVQAKCYIDEHYAGPLDIKAMAGEACFSPFHFLRLFKSIYGKTPHQYLTHVRMMHARRLLAAGSSVQDACFSVGFESVSSFTGLFKKLTGVAPSIYVTKQRLRQAAIRKAPLQFIPGCFAAAYGWKEKQF